MKLFRLPKSLCLRWHAAYSVPYPQGNIRQGSKFFVAIMCNRCVAVRTLEHWKCQECGFFFKPKVYAEHRKDCRLVIEATNINREVEATENDFRYLYDVAARHGISEVDLIPIARVETGKSLAEFSKREVIEFAERIAGGARAIDN